MAFSKLSFNFEGFTCMSVSYASHDGFRCLGQQRLTHLPAHCLEGRLTITLDVRVGDRLGDPLVA